MKRLFIILFIPLFALDCTNPGSGEFGLDLDSPVESSSVKTISQADSITKNCPAKTRHPKNRNELKKLIENVEDDADLSYIDTSSIIDMKELFKNKTSFNGDISCWDVANVTNMAFMFAFAYSFNQDISKWDVSNVTDMQGMFFDATVFNQDISKWDVSNVTNMASIFTSTKNFNNGGQPLAWGNKTKNVKNMGRTFMYARVFNQDISKWDVSNVTNMYQMFTGATIFNQDISEWDVSSVTNMLGMFFNAKTFNQNISNWDVSNVTNMQSMFYNAKAFNNDGQPKELNEWKVSKDTNIKNTLKYTAMKTYPSWCTETCR